MSAETRCIDMNIQEHNFEKKVMKSSRCWNYTGDHPTPQLFAWEKSFGDVPLHMLVQSICANERCVKPTHLYLALSIWFVPEKPSLLTQIYSFFRQIILRALRLDDHHRDTKS